MRTEAEGRRCGKDGVRGPTLPEVGWYYLIAASECVVQTTWKNLANAFEDILKYIKCIEEACHGSVKLIGQWDERVDRFERNYGSINTKMIRTLGKLTVIDNPRTSFIKDDKNDLISVREYDDGFSDYKSAEAQVETANNKIIDDLDEEKVITFICPVTCKYPPLSSCTTRNHAMRVIVAKVLNLDLSSKGALTSLL